MVLWPHMTVNLAAFFAVSTAYFYLGSIPEEQKLVEEFGDAYRRYQQLVPRLIPWPWRAYRSQERSPSDLSRINDDGCTGNIRQTKR